MKARPILFSAPMIRALLDGSKTQTRRVVKPQSPGHVVHGHGYVNDPADVYRFKGGPTLRCPYGQPGDLLWVRETWSDYWMHEDDAYGEPVGGGIDYRATWNLSKGDTPPWKPSIHMPRWASRLTLELTEVRVERLQDISEVDALAEGVEPLFDADTAKSRSEFDLSPMPFSNYLWHGNIGRTITASQSDKWPHQFSSYKEARDSYSSLWEFINGLGSWAANPWVWVLEFRVHHQNVDALLKERAAA